MENPEFFWTKQDLILASHSMNLHWNSPVAAHASKRAFEALFGSPKKNENNKIRKLEMRFK